MNNSQRLDGVLSTPCATPDTHAQVWLFAGSKPPVLLRGNCYPIQTATTNEQSYSHKYIQPTHSIVTGGQPVVLAEASPWIKCKNKNKFVASVSIVIRGTDVVRVKMPPSSVSQPPGVPLYIVDRNVPCSVGFTTSNTMLGILSTDFNHSDHEAMTYFTLGRGAQANSTMFSITSADFNKLEADAKKDLSTQIAELA